MKYSYLLKHWFTTLLVSPLLLFIYSFVKTEIYDFTDQLEVFIIFLMFSILFALPTIIISIILFYNFSKKESPTTVLKVVVILTTVIGTSLTLFIISNTVAVEYSVVYSLVAILSGAFLKVKRKTF